MFGVTHSMKNDLNIKDSMRKAIQKWIWNPEVTKSESETGKKI